MKKVLALIALVMVVIQFIPYGRDHVNPAIVAEPKWDTPQTRELFFRACADCHSHETKWPAYSNIAPISWLVQYDVNEGREHFNVSMWGAQKKNEGEDAAEEVESGEMAPWFYLVPHPEARHSDDEKKLFLKGLVATFGEGKDSDEKEHDHDHN